MRRLPFALMATCLLWTGPSRAQEEAARVVEVQFSVVRRAQLAVWVERSDGTYLRTLALTQATAVRGIGNRPGATQMNSGYNWPYGRREGVLPVWAHRRAGAEGAAQFARVIFQDRTSEGWASRSSSDFSRDDYYCLSFTQSVSGRDNLDAMTCPSVFNSDKGRYLRASDVAAGYSEPFETAPGSAIMRRLDTVSLYPPRRDVTRCVGGGCFDHEDVERFARDARAVMPEIDAVTMATPPEGELTTVAFTVPDDWPDGDYVMWVEANTEGDYNRDWNAERFPTPEGPEGEWDYWARRYGYPYRGQPSVAFSVPFSIGGGAFEASVIEPAGYGSLDGSSGDLLTMDGTIANDPTTAPGSGADRLFAVDGARLRVTVIGPEVCQDNFAPGPVDALSITEHAEQRHAHRYASLAFVGAADDVGVTRYQVRVGQEPIVDEASFERALPARAATLEHEALVLPNGIRQGDPVEVDIGGLAPESHYFVAIRAVDRCNVPGPLSVVEHTTPAIHFTTVSPCFVATAAYGTPLAAEIGALRRFRDRHLRSHALGGALVALYEVLGPHLAAIIRRDEGLRSLTRSALAPIIALARWLD